MCGRVPGCTGVQVEEDHGVARMGSEEVHLAGRKLRPEVHVRAVGVVVILEVVDDGTVVELAENDGGPKAAMTHNQVRLEVSSGLAGFVHPVRVPYGIFERPRAVMGLAGRG